MFIFYIYKNKNINFLYIKSIYSNHLRAIHQPQHNRYQTTDNKSFSGGLKGFFYKKVEEPRNQNIRQENVKSHNHGKRLLSTSHLLYPKYIYFPGSNMIDLCPYKNLIGEPKQGIHSTRVMDIAIMDVVISLFGAYLLSILLPYKHAFLYAIFIVFGLGIVLHRLFCVRTTVDKWLFTE